MKMDDFRKLIESEEKCLAQGKNILSELKGFIEENNKLLMRNKMIFSMSNKLQNSLKHANDELRITSSTDPLTKVYNKSELNNFINKLLKDNTGSSKCNFFLFFIDLDNFKYYNDTFGHEIGDLILINFVEIIRGSIRSSDFLARFGGDEFILILCNISKESCQRVINILKRKINSKDGFQNEIGKMLSREVEISADKRLSFSAGITEYRTDLNICNVEELITQADKSLYQAKKMGKNCCVFSE